MKKILCYGDSNTWGFVPGSFDITTGQMQRYPRDIRWTGQLQKLLGNDYLIIEEGLCGRNTNIDNPEELGGAGSNGKTYLQPCLLSHAPIDCVILMHGSNDLKASLNRSAEDVARGLEELIQIIKTSNYEKNRQHALKILLLAPPVLTTNAGMFSEIFRGADEKSKSLPVLYKKLADKYDCDYLDMSLYINMSDADGLHIDEKDQHLFAKLVSSNLISVSKQ